MKRRATKSPDAKRAHTELRLAMLRRGMSAQDLADELGYRRNFLYNIIEGHTDSPPARRKIEAYFGRAFWSIPGQEQLTASAKPFEAEKTLKSNK